MRFIRRPTGRLLGCLFAVALLLSGLARTWADVAPVFTEIDGSWLVTQRVYTPSCVTDPVGNLLTNLGYETEIGASTFSACDPDKVGNYLSISIDSSADPKTIDLTVPADPNNPGAPQQVLLGIYTLDSNGNLTIAVSTGSTRPTKLLSPDDTVTLVLAPSPN